VANSQKLAGDVSSLLRHGLLAGRAGNYSEARLWFRAALDVDPDNITVLLWLAWLAPTRHESLALLSRVLELDPKNKRAHAAIRWTRRRPSISQVSPDVPDGGDLLDADQQPKVQGVHRLISPLGLLLVVAVCLFVSGVGLVARYSPAAVLAWVLPTATPTITPTPTFTSTPTAIPTATATFTPTPTPSPTPTATVPNTPAPTLTSSPMPTPAVPPLSPSATPLPAISSPLVAGEKWIDVDLTLQRLTAYEGNTPIFQALVSTGLPNTPTVVGQFRIYWKLSSTAMAGPGYYLPGVPYTMYFYRGYALHGTYWHNNFGQPMSHGCVNLRTEDAQWLFNWADPPLPDGASYARASDANPGTLVVVHY
jgi:lipoprotein-anchoring transpeptidase ErfK/SrfK